MKTIEVAGENWGSEAEAEFIRVIKDGGIVLHPTETCYGLAVSIMDEDALNRVYKLKKMARLKPISVIVADIEDAEKWANLDTETKSMMKKYWPGPYTFIVRKKDTLPEYFNHGTNSVGYRNPSVRSLLNIVKELGFPITTTSANVTGYPQTYRIEDFLFQLKEAGSDMTPDLVLNGGFIEGGTQSVIYDTISGTCIRGELKNK